MDARHSDIRVARDVHTQKVQGFRGFFGHRLIRGTCRYHRHRPLARSRRLRRTDATDAGAFAILPLSRRATEHARKNALDRFGLIRLQASDQNTVATVDQSAGDFRNLFGALARSKNHLRRARAHLPVVVHASEAEIGERQALELLERFGRRALSRSDALEQSRNRLGGKRESLGRRFLVRHFRNAYSRPRHGRRFDRRPKGRDVVCKSFRCG